MLCHPVTGREHLLVSMNLEQEILSTAATPTPLGSLTLLFAGRGVRCMRCGRGNDGAPPAPRPSEMRGGETVLLLDRGRWCQGSRPLTLCRCCARDRSTSELQLAITPVCWFVGAGHWVPVQGGYSTTLRQRCQLQLFEGHPMVIFLAEFLEIPPPDSSC